MRPGVRACLSTFLAGMVTMGGCSTEPSSALLGSGSNAGQSVGQRAGLSAGPTVKLGGQPTLSRIDRLGIGDKIKVTVFGEQDLSGPFDVGATGALSLPLIGEIPAKGHTIAEVKAAIVGRLRAGYLKDPKVSVEVVTYRPFYVHGEVKSGGEIAFKNGVTIRDAVAIAGGYTYRAKQDHVLLIREDTGQEVRVALPSTDLVMPGDNIRVPERFF